LTPHLKVRYGTNPIVLPISELTPMAKPTEKVFWSEEEKLAIVMRANAAVQRALLMAAVL
jgi:hypothetical protein